MNTKATSTGLHAFPFLLATLALLVTTGIAQEPGKSETPRNPFAAPPGVRAPGSSEGTAFVPHETPRSLPALALRGYVEDAKGNACALLQVDAKEVYLVRQGDEVSLPRTDGTLVLKVQKVSNLSLHIEVGELKRLVVVR